MASAKITKTVVEKARVEDDGPRQQFIWDTEVKGFGLCVSATSKSFVYRKAGRQVALGRYPEVEVEDARKAAGRAAAEWDERRKLSRKRDRVTLRQAQDRHVTRMRNRGRSERSIADLEYLIGRHLGDWLDRRLESIDRRLVRERHERIGERCGRYTANHTFRWFRACWHTAMREDETLPACPTVALDWYKEEARDEKVDDLRAWWLAVQRVDNPVRRVLQMFVLTTGLRSEDARTVRWEDIDLEQATLHRPSPKGGRDRAFTVPLSAFTFRLLLRWHVTVDKIYPGSPWVFPTRDRQGRVIHVKTLKETRRGLPGPHVLRHTYASAASACGTNFAVMKTLLNHTTGRGDITMRYVHVDIDHMRAAQEAVTAYLLGRAKKPRKGGEMANVVPFKRSA